MVVLEGEKNPSPDVVQLPVVVAPPITAPLTVAFGLFAQENRSGPAFTNGASVMVIVIEEAIGIQPCVEVNVSVTEPAAVSAEDGVYVGVRFVTEGEKVPDPEVVQKPVPVELVAPTSTMALFAQTV